jgi:hypothetical protein
VVEVVVEVVEVEVVVVMVVEVEVVVVTVVLPLLLEKRWRSAPCRTRRRACGTTRRSAKSRR